MDEINPMGHYHISDRTRAHGGMRSICDLVNINQSTHDVPSIYIVHYNIYHFKHFYNL